MMGGSHALQPPTGTVVASSARAPAAASNAPRLRPWQRAALEAFEAAARSDFLAVATPGAGKTTFALTAARRALVRRAIRRAIIVVPTQHLKFQWAHAAEKMDIHLDPEWNVGYGGRASHAHAVVVTYQQGAAS